MKMDGIIIIVGRTFSGKDELVAELSLKGCSRIATSTSMQNPEVGFVEVDNSSFVRNIDEYVGIGAFDGDFYGVNKKELGFSGTGVITTTPASAKSMYGWAIQNDITPMLVYVNPPDGDRYSRMLEQGGSDAPAYEQNLRDIKTIEEISRIDIPVAIEARSYKPGMGDRILDTFEIVKKYTPEPLGIKAARSAGQQQHIVDLLDRVEADAKNFEKYQLVAASALSVGLLAAGNIESAAILFGSFWTLRKEFGPKNYNMALFKEQGFSLLDRIKYFIGSSFTDDGSRAPVRSKEDLDAFLESIGNTNAIAGKNPLFNAIDAIEKKFDNIFLTTEGMSTAKKLFEIDVLADISGSCTKSQMLNHA